MFKVFLGIFITLTSSTSYSKENTPSSFSWVGLLNEKMINWAENENQISRLCPTSLVATELKQCKNQYLSEKHWSIHAYAQPNSYDKKLGEIVVTIKPGGPLKTTFKQASGKLIDFTPDLFDQDWGYGPYFHQSVLEQKGDWIKIAIANSLPHVWINPKYDIQRLDILPVSSGDIYTFRNESIVIIKISGDTVLYRLENKADMWCDDGEPPKISAQKIKKLKIKQFFENGHLMLDKKYKRGC